MSLKYGVFLARMQPVHNAHLLMVNKALKECDKVLIVLGSENKVDMLRNPFDITLREQLLRESLSKKDNERIMIMTLPDWSMESDVDNAKIWGRYLYYNIVSRIGQKRFELYYSDDQENLNLWFDDTEVKEYITYKLFNRNNMFDALSATKIRQAFISGDKEYVKKYCPPSVYARFTYLASYYKNINKCPKEDFSMD